MDPFGVVGTAIAGKYRVDRVIGEGGFGVVYAGFHQVIGQPVAIKLMKPAGGPDSHARGADAFLREARVLFDLAHPCIVRLYDVGTTATRLGVVPYVVLELIAGVSLAEEVRRRQRAEAPPFSVAELFAIFDGLLDGLASAHARGVAHRDLKPSNVMLTRDPAGAITPKILDFGTARAAARQGAQGGSSSPPVATAAVGFTPLYAAPEQWDARFGPTGPATDVFAVGLLLAETVLLAPPLAGEGMAQIAGAAMDASRRPSITSRRPDIPRDIDAVMLRATRPVPAERFADAAQMRVALRAAFGAGGAPMPAPLAFTMAPMQQMLAAPVPPPGGAMIHVGGPPPPPGALTTNAPVQHFVPVQPRTQPSPSAHPLSIAALIVGLAALGAVLAFAVVLVMYMRQSQDAAAVAPPPAAPAAPAPAPVPAPAASTKDPSRGTPSPVAPTPAPTHAADAGGVAPPHPAGDPRVLIGVALANAFDPPELKRLAESHRGELLACYRAALAHDATFRSTATVTVFNTMGAQDCHFDNRKDDEADAMCGCLKSTISNWKIPKPNNVWGSALFEYTLSFTP